MAIPFKRVVIIGVGLIGGSIAAAMKELDDAPIVIGIGRHAEPLEKARQQGALDEYALVDDPRVDEWLSSGECDLVIIATPVHAARDWFERLEACGYDGVITDVASTKAVITGYADGILSHPDRYLPGHPMAGSEANGFGAARADLFQGAYWILCPEGEGQDETFLKLYETFGALGSRIISISRDQHDSAIAIVSHVPHMVASSLVELAGNHVDERQELLRLAAGGFKDSTRIAAGSPELWCGIALDNSEALSQGLHEVGEIIGRFETAIREGDAETLVKMLEDSARLRRSLPAKWIPDSAKLTQVRIPMPDHPGIIAEVTGMAGHAACNIQSIEIDHINEDTAVLELILTDEGDMGRFGGELITKGYDFSIRSLEEEL